MKPEILRAVTEAGYTEPTSIQARAIPEVLARHDLIGIAQTGTGKTASFVLPMLDILAKGRGRARMPRSIILSPTRELATQTARNFDIYGKYLSLSMALIIGGVGMGDQEKLLEKGVDVLIATPGRLLDWYERGKVLLGGVDILVIDEADRMFDMGFMPDVEKIVSLLLGRKQTLLFSATMPPEVRRLADRFLKTPTEIQVSRPASANLQIEDVFVEVTGSDKREALARVIKQNEVPKAIVFCNRKRDISGVMRFLQKAGLNARDLHGDLDQSQRQQTLDQFTSGQVDFLVATDVAARGLDVTDMPVVFNFDVPLHAEDYVHRIGRTGRAGRKGHAFTFVTGEDFKLVAAIERLIKRTIPRVVIDLEAPKKAPRTPARAVATAQVQAEAEMEPVAKRAAKPATKRTKLADAPEAAAAEPRAGTRRRRGLAGGKVAEIEQASVPPASAPEPRAPAAARPTPVSYEQPNVVRPAPARTGSDTGGRHSQPPQRQPGRRNDEAPVIAFGDMIPRFLLNAAPVSPPSRTKSSDAMADGVD